MELVMYKTSSLLVHENLIPKYRLWIVSYQKHRYWVQIFMSVSFMFKMAAQ